MENFYRPADIARILKCTREHAGRLKLPWINVGEKRFKVVSVADFEAFMAQKKIESEKVHTPER